MNYSQLKTQWQNRIGVTDDNNLILPGLVNECLRDITRVNRFEFYKTHDTIPVVADYSVGTASVVNGSSSVTISVAATLTDGMTGQLFKASSDNNWYIIDSVNTSTRVITLSAPYIGTTDAAASYTIWHWSVQMPSNYSAGGLKSIVLQSMDQVVEVVDEDSYLVRWPDPTVQQGNPSLAFEVGDSTLLLAPLPVADDLLYVSYYRKATELDLAPDDTDELDLPVEYHDLILYYCLTHHAASIRDSVLKVWQQDYARMLVDMVRKHGSKSSVKHRSRAWSPRFGRRGPVVIGLVGV